MYFCSIRFTANFDGVLMSSGSFPNSAFFDVRAAFDV
jgi:hypothetical protein